MKHSNLLVVLILLTLGFNCERCYGQTQASKNILQLDKGSEPGKAKIENLKWLAGQWEGKGLGGIVDEGWSAPKNGHMSGYFRVFKNSKLLFSEYFTISENNDSLTLSLLHFDPKLHGWEEKGKPVVSRLVKVDGNAAYFDGLTYRLNKDGSMNAIVLAKSKEGKTSELLFQLRRPKSENKK